MHGEDMPDSLVHIAICDDDAATRQAHIELVEGLGRAHGLPLAVHVYEGGNPLLFDLDDRVALWDVVLLDILMPGMDGVRVAAKLRERGYIGAIVFVSRSDGFVFDAFDVGAFNYVVKAGGGERARLESVLLSAVSHMRRRKRKYILVNGISEHRNIAIDSIRYLESRKHICVVHYGRDAECEFISSLQRIENALLPYRFVRIHRSYLVNCEYVERYSFQSCVLRDGTKLPVGRQRYQALRQAMESGTELGLGNA